MDAIVGALQNARQCAPQEVNYNDTYALSYLNSDHNSAPFTEESSWLFEEGTRDMQVKELMAQELKQISKQMLGE